MILRPRLLDLMERGNLTVADLARWFDRPDATVRAWIRNERSVRGIRVDHAHISRQVILLEKQIGRKMGLPVPPMTQSRRLAYLSDLRKRCG